MNTKIPKFLLEMSEQLNTQDNRITADPIFCVCYDEKLPTSEDYAEDGVFTWYAPQECSEIGSSDDDLIEYLNDYHGDFMSKFSEDEDINIEDIDIDCLEYETLPAEIHKIHQMTNRKIIKSSLTEIGAQQFIDRKQHDYPKLYIYAESMCYQHQMIELRQWIMSLTKEKKL
tara:strand:+ start:217 stop:732 length:516 start_codon:yes stop_codon:yes gene_type:complete